MTMKRARRAGLTNWADVEPLTTDELDARLYHRRRPEEGERPRPDPVWIHTERQKRKGVTLEAIIAELSEMPEVGCPTCGGRLTCRPLPSVGVASSRAPPVGEPS